MMAIIGRRVLRSGRRKSKRIDTAFATVAHTLLVLFALFYLSVWFSERELFRIDKIRIEASAAISALDVRAIAEEHISGSLLYRIDKNNALLLPRQAIAGAVLALDARIKHVDIDLVGAKELVVGVEEFLPSFLWCPKESDAERLGLSCFLSDEFGYIFAPAPTFSGSPFTVIRSTLPGGGTLPVGQYVLPESEFVRVIEFNKELSDIGLHVREIAHVDAGDYVFDVDAPWSILWSTAREGKESASDLALALPEIESALSEKTGTSTVSRVDLRFSKKIFYK